MTVVYVTLHRINIGTDGDKDVAGGPALDRMLKLKPGLLNFYIDD